MSQFPPTPVYPLAIDDDYTLLLVHNTSEAATAADSEQWGEEITIKPVGDDELEVWGDNGFANIGGELFYYDAVEKNAAGKVFKFKRCARNLGGDNTKFNPAGSMVRGFVVAEHHNILVDAVVGVEKFVGYNFTPDTETLDWRIRNLRQIPIIFDDYGCPDVSFDFVIVSEDPSEGTLARYKIQVVGDFNQFSLNFGDGTSTVSLEEGTHRYAPNAKIDPVVTFATERCTIVQTAVTRDSSDQPLPDIAEQPFVIPTLPEITIPTIPPFPNIDVDTDVNLPPNLFPCFEFPNIGPIGPINIPSIIIFEPTLNIPSFIDFGDINIPSFSFPDIDVNIPSIPDIIVTVPSFPDIDVNVPSFPGFDIDVNVPSLPDINLIDDIPVNIPVIDDIPINIDLIDDIPDIIVVESNIPDVIVTVDDIPELIVVDANIPDFVFVLDDVPDIIVTVDDIPETIFALDDIPDTIFLLDDVPDTIFVTDDIPDNIFVVDDIPNTITVTDDIPSNIPVTFPSPPCIPVCWGSPPTIPVVVTVSCPTSPSTSMAGMTDMNMRELMATAGGEFMSPDDIEVSYDISGFPSEIKILPPDDIIIRHDIPNEILVKGFHFDPIEFNVPELPSIKLEMPDTPLKIEAIGLPDKLMLEVSDDFPRFIQLSFPMEMPTVKLDVSDMPSTITVVGMPTTISIDPIQIELKVPDFIPLSYVGDPIPVSVAVQLELNLNKMLLDNADGVQCVAIVSCPR